MLFLRNMIQANTQCHYIECTSVLHARCPSEFMVNMMCSLNFFFLDSEFFPPLSHPTRDEHMMYPEKEGAGKRTQISFGGGVRDFVCW